MQLSKHEIQHCLDRVYDTLIVGADLEDDQQGSTYNVFVFPV
jgi:hypothetical protein